MFFGNNNGYFVHVGKLHIQIQLVYSAHSFYFDATQTSEWFEFWKWVVITGGGITVAKTFKGTEYSTGSEEGIMNWLIENWYLLVGGVALIVVAGFAVYRFVGLPTKAQVAKIKEWLKYAVTMAEKELGGKTGQLKLRMVYDMFVSKFPSVAKLISFDTFASWVDDALEWMNKQLRSKQGY